MNVKQALVIALVTLGSACSPPAQPSAEAPVVAAPQQSSNEALLNVLTALVSSEIGAPVSLQPATVNVTDEWAYVVAQTRNADGSPINWSTTALASRYENGAMDEGGGVHALLHNESGVWVIVEHVIAPTDVAWLDWAARHEVPASVFESPATP